MTEATRMTRHLLTLATRYAEFDEKPFLFMRHDVQEMARGLLDQGQEIAQLQARVHELDVQVQFLLDTCVVSKDLLDDTGSDH